MVRISAKSRVSALPAARARGPLNLSLHELDRHVERMAPHLVVLSPGPGRPEEARIMPRWLETDPEVPVLGICLGHQALAVAAGGTVGPAPAPIHGRSDRIVVAAEERLFEPLAPSFDAARYHSLVVTPVPDSMKVVATTAEGDLVIALRHRERCRVGLQFHPESILTPPGRQILWRFLDEALGDGGKR